MGCDLAGRLVRSRPAASHAVVVHELVAERAAGLGHQLPRRDLHQRLPELGLGPHHLYPKRCALRFQFTYLRDLQLATPECKLANRCVDQQTALEIIGALYLGFSLRNAAVPLTLKLDYQYNHA